MELHSRCLFGYNVRCGWPVRWENDSPCGRGHRWSLTLACLHGLQPFFSFSFLHAAERASFLSWRDLSALSVSRLTIWGLLLPSCSGQCSRLLRSSCTHLWIMLWSSCGTFSEPSRHIFHLHTATTIHIHILNIINNISNIIIQSAIITAPPATVSLLQFNTTLFILSQIHACNSSYLCQK